MTTFKPNFQTLRYSSVSVWSESSYILRKPQNLSNVVTIKSMVKISQNFVAFSEYMNFISVLQKKKQLFKKSK